MPLAPIDAIDSERLSLRPLAADHLADLMAVNGDERVTRFVPYATWTSSADAQAWHDRMQTLCAGGTAHQLVLLRRLDGRAIGTLLLFKHDEASRRIELGYALGHDCWGQGLMREAVEAACAHAFGEMDIRRIEAEVNPANGASCALLERVGFTLEGWLRQRWTGKGAIYDTHLYGLLVGEWSVRRDAA